MSERRETYVYDKNRRYEVSAGTRCALVQLDIPWSDIRAAGHPASQTIESVVHEARKRYTARAVEEAADLWWVKFGEPVPWDLVQILVSHVTAQVAVELRVEDR